MIADLIPRYHTRAERILLCDEEQRLLVDARYFRSLVVPILRTRTL